MQKIVFTLLVVLCCGVTAQADEHKILVLGDSLSAAFGISQEQGWVALLQQRLTRTGEKYQVINASISGETTAGGLSRLPALLQRHEPDIVILELGANDGLRGLSLNDMHANLARMIELSRARGAEVLLLGMQLPPNYGPTYTRQFHEVYARLAESEDVALVPFLLAGVAQQRSLFQADGLHPSAAAQDELLENVWDKLQSLLTTSGAV
ncbi:arylesterase [Candidatus Tenderia electrophaga]|uniref:Arylesterase n=1 Tax=Candidatus Tenderia electrophaga TaxID=1748243 RepID=A0A0S2TIB9_9GAMM|nr:arylesterase [Candidatus Tenderia electrophaga]